MQTNNVSIMDAFPNSFDSVWPCDTYEYIYESDYPNPNHIANRSPLINKNQC